MDINEMKTCRVVLEPLKTPKAQIALSAELRNAILERNMLTSRTSKKFISALDNIQQTEDDKKKQKLRLRVIKEILSSEEMYIKQLILIKEYFMNPLKDKCILSIHDFNTLFGNINTIFNVNKELASELKRNPGNIAAAFLKLGPFLKIYSVYAYDYKKSLSILQEAQSNNAEFNKFLQDQESRPEVQNKLSALLITPIQRVPRYRLLLKQVLDATNPRNPDYKALLTSLQKVEEAATHINNLVEEQENTQLLLELQRSLHGNEPNIIKPGRRYIKAGFLKKMSVRGNHSYNRYVVLMNDIIMYCKPLKEKPHLPHSLKCSCILPLNKCKIVQMRSKGAFKLDCQDETITFYHESAGEYEDWVREIKNALKKYLDDRQTLRKDSSARVPLRKRRLLEEQDKGLSPGKKLKKKRRAADKEFENVFRSAKRDSDDSDTADGRLCFPRSTYKRARATATTPADKEDSPDYYKPKKVIKFDEPDASSNGGAGGGGGRDCLYPLRRETIHNGAKTYGADASGGGGDAAPNENSMQLVPFNDDVLVFGQNGGEVRPFNFSIRGIVAGIGNSFRRAFGLRSA